MAYLNTNSFYSSFAKKTKGSGSVPSKTQGIISPGSSTGLYPAAPKPPAPVASPAAPSGPVGAPTGFTRDAGRPSARPGLSADTRRTDGHTRDDTIAGLKQARTSGLSDYGYTETTGPDGLPQIAFDPNNPYSQAALLRKHYQQAKLGNTTSYAAAGQLYAGSLQNAENASYRQLRPVQ
jgi:hypothetical protein